jgi:hypothetical protein
MMTLHIIWPFKKAQKEHRQKRDNCTEYVFSSFKMAIIAIVIFMFKSAAKQTRNNHQRHQWINKTFGKFWCNQIHGNAWGLIMWSLKSKYFEYKYICMETPIITIHHHSLLKIRHRRFAKRLRDK